MRLLWGGSFVSRALTDKSKKWKTVIARESNVFLLSLYQPKCEFHSETFTVSNESFTVKSFHWKLSSGRFCCLLDKRTFAGKGRTALSLHFNLRATTADRVIALWHSRTTVSVTVEFLLFVFICHSLLRIRSLKFRTHRLSVKKSRNLNFGKFPTIKIFDNSYYLGNSKFKCPRFLGEEQTHRSPWSYRRQWITISEKRGELEMEDLELVEIEFTRMMIVRYTQSSCWASNRLTARLWQIEFAAFSIWLLSSLRHTSQAV